MRSKLMAISGFVLSLAIQANQLGVAYAAGPAPVNLTSVGKDCTDDSHDDCECPDADRSSRGRP